MVQKYLVKADPDVLGEFCLGLLARFLIRIMHKSSMLLKRWRLPVSSSDFKLTGEILEFLEEYDPQIIKMNTTTTAVNLNSLDSTSLNSEKDSEFDRKKLNEDEEREKEQQKKEIEKEIRIQQEMLIQKQMELFQIYASQTQNKSEQSNREITTTIRENNIIINNSKVSDSPTTITKPLKNQSNDEVMTSIECQESQQIVQSEFKREQTDETIAQDNQIKEKQSSQQPLSISTENIQKSSSSARKVTPIKSTYSSVSSANPLKVNSLTKLKAYKSTIGNSKPSQNNNSKIQTDKNKQSKHDPITINLENTSQLPILKIDLNDKTS